VTARAIEIYRHGQTMGLDPHAFSKVGDCQSVKAALMGYFDIPDRYSRNDYTNLLPTIDNFAGHLNTEWGRRCEEDSMQQQYFPVMGGPESLPGRRESSRLRTAHNQTNYRHRKPGNLVGWAYTTRLRNVDAPNSG